MVRMFGLIAAMLAIVAGGAGTALAQDATPMAGPATEARFADTMGLPELAITVTDTAFEGVPAETSAGRYVVTLTNTSSAPGYVHFMQLPAGETLETLFAPPPDVPIGTPMAGMDMGTPAAEEGGEGGGIPPWYYEVYHAGGVGEVAPGGVGQVILDLAAGNYIVWAGDPEAPQAPVPLTVTGGPMPGTPMTGLAEPTANATVTEVKTADGFAFELTGALQPGPNVIEIHNDSDQPHFFIGIRSPVPLSDEQLQMLLTFDPSMGTPPAGLPNPDELPTAFFANTQSQGTTQWLAANLEPGYYIIACFIEDPTKDGIPHAFEGMVDVIQVGDGGAMATPGA